MSTKDVISALAIIFVIILAFTLGWLFPVEGPYDYLYDEHASHPSHKHPTLRVVPDPQQIVILFTDLSLDDLEVMEKEYDKSRGVEKGGKDE